MRGNRKGAHVGRVSTYIPPSVACAEKHFKGALGSDLKGLGERDFLKAYCSMAYLYPGFHPDSLEDWEGPKEVVKLANEAWRRADAGLLSENELYPYEATKARIVQEMRGRLGR